MNPVAMPLIDELKGILNVTENQIENSDIKTKNESHFPCKLNDCLNGGLCYYRSLYLIYINR